MSAPGVEPDLGPRPALARRTRREFLQRHCDTDTLVLTAHFPPPSFGRVVPRGDAFWFQYGE
jgi:hypothetical protein